MIGLLNTTLVLVMLFPTAVVGSVDPADLVHADIEDTRQIIIEALKLRAGPIEGKIMQASATARKRCGTNEN